MVMAHMYVQAEREGNDMLQRYCLKRMGPYFMAAGHFFYGRYIWWWVKEHENIEENVEVPWPLGDHVCHHKDGVWNDQFGEQT